jgi:anti-anti-sigma regulatory factor
LLKKLLEEGFLKFRFDFSEVKDIDSVGLSAFIVLSRMLAGRPGETELKIVNVHPDIASLFRMTHLDKVYTISEKKN